MRHHLDFLVLGLSLFVSGCCGTGPAPKFVYWADHGTASVQCSQIGSGIVETLDEYPGHQPFSTVIDPAQNLLFCTVRPIAGGPPPRFSIVYRRELDSEVSKEIVRGTVGGEQPGVLGIDRQNSLLYFGVALPLSPAHPHGAWAIDRCDYNGQQRTRVLEVLDKPVMAVMPDPKRGCLLFVARERTAPVRASLWEINLATMKPREVIPPSERIGNTIRATLGPKGEWFYFGDASPVAGGGSLRRLRRARVDGTNVEDLKLVCPMPPVSPVSYVAELEIDTTARPMKIYWADINRNWIARANLDGTEMEIVVALPAGKAEAPDPHPTGLALGPGPRSDPSGRRSPTDSSRTRGRPWAGEGGTILCPYCGANHLGHDE